MKKVLNSLLITSSADTGLDYNLLMFPVEWLSKQIMLIH